MDVRPSARLVIVASVVAFVVAALFLGVSYTSATRGCESCHDKVHTTWTKGTHASVSCVRCHVPSSPTAKLNFGVNVVMGMRLRLTDVSSGGATDIPNLRCMSCHIAVNKGAQVVGQSVKLNHEACAATSRCVRCHGSVVHGPDQRLVRGIDMFECLDCHTKVGQAVECDSCHPGRLKKDRITTGTFAVTHGPKWREAHGVGSVSACSACHDEAKCGKCHGIGVPHGSGFVPIHGAYAQAPEQKCESCHQPTFCNLCHGVLMPHPRQFKNEHSTIVRQSGEKQCRRCHSETDCTTCHTLHVHPGGAIGGELP